MPSPFPGMDPWLEDSGVFPDLHESLIFLLKGAINAGLPPGYVATSKNRVWIDEARVREPDVSVFGDRPVGEGGVAILTGLVAVEGGLESDPVEESYLEILSVQGKRLITAVEVVSLTNKLAGKRGRKTYLRKQKEYHRAGVNLVEIDLLRSGPHVTAVPLDRLERTVGPFHYHISVRTEHPHSRFFAAGIRLSERLPAIGIPLDRGTPPVTVELQPLLDQAYDSGRYTSLADYTAWCNPPLPAAQRTWAEAILREKGLLPAAV